MRRGSSSAKGGRGRQHQWRPGGKRGQGAAVEARKVRETKGGSSGQWMRRHLKDPYVAAALETGAPSRAAFKLVEMNDRHAFLSPGDSVIDLGAAPGGWSMIAARIVHRSKHARRWASGGGSRKWRVGSPPPIPPPLMPPAGAEESGRARLRQGGVSYEGRVVAVDLLSMEALPGVEVIRGDFRDPVVRDRILAVLADSDRREHAAEVSEDCWRPETARGDRAMGESMTGVRDTSLSPGWSSSARLLPRPADPTADILELAATHSPDVEEVDDAEFETGARHPRSTNPGTRRRCRANVVLSDMAPSFSGNRDIDQARVAALLLDALAACVGDERERLGPKAPSDGGFVENGRGGGLLTRGGTFLGKFLAGRDEREVKDEAERLFDKVRVLKPPASRSASSEMYLLAMGFLEK